VTGDFMETDPAKIKKLAKEKEYENMEFRLFLKQIDMSPEEVDKVVHRIYREVSSQIDCAACRNCCKELVPALHKEDIERLSKVMGMSVDQFTEQYVEQDEFGDHTFKKPCPLFKDNTCMYPDDRPEACKSYPYLDKEGFVFRTIGVVQNCFVCPIVYNTYERLKGELWHYNFDDYDDLECFDELDEPDELEDLGELEELDIFDILEILNDLYFSGGYNENA